MYNPIFIPSSTLFALSVYTTYLTSIGRTAVRSNPTSHNETLNTKYEPQQPDRLSNTPSKASDAVPDIMGNDDGPRSPLESNAETWEHPPRAKTHQKRLGTLNEIPLDEAPKDHSNYRPTSYYDGLPTSPEPETTAVSADLPAAPPSKRLSRPYEQPYPIHNHGLTPGQGQAAAVPMRATMTRADSHPRRQPAQFSHQNANRKAAPAPIAIPPRAHRSSHHSEPSSDQEDQARRQRPCRQEDRARVQRPARHQGWNPLKEAPAQQRSAHAHYKNHRRGDDLEWQGELGRSKHNDPQYKSGRRCFFFLLIMMISAVVIVVVMVEKNRHQQ
ncbi:MAG: hypothetical protein Q9175_000485 [Cornicularia normoerica]